MNQDISQNTDNKFHISIEVKPEDFNDLNELSVLDLLTQHTNLSKQKLKQACKHGAVWLIKPKINKRQRNAKKDLKTGDIIEIYYDERLINTPLSKPTLIADEGDYSIWYKPYGLLSQGTEWGDFHSLLRFVEFNLLPQRPAFLVHRLDREASGIMLICHNKETAAKFSSKFSARDINKYYQAIVEGNFPKETVVLDNAIEGKEALSIINRLAYDEKNNQSLVEVDLKTGRKHQIRQHLCNFGYPIIGDTIYGNSVQGGKVKLQLCAIRLGFNYPNRKTYKEYKLDKQFLLKFS